MLAFLKTTIRTATAIFIALLAISICFGLYGWIKDYNERSTAKPFETVKVWHTDLSASWGVRINAKTKLVANTLLVSTSIDGHPKYFSYPSNLEKLISFEFLDKDGFTVFSQTVSVSELTRVIDKNGTPSGFQYQFDKPLSVDEYKRFEKMEIGSNLLTKADTENVAEESKRTSDHCEPSLTKKERLKRLSQTGTVRETGLNSFSAGDHSVTFFDNGEVLICR